MKKNDCEFFRKLKNPPTFIKVLVFVFTAISVIGSLCILFVDYKNGLLLILAYCLFAFAALFLAYSVFLIVIAFPKIKKQINEKIQKHKFSRLLANNYGFRTIIFSIFSFAMSVFFGGFNVYMCVTNSSVWYGALAGYYVSLAFLRGGVLVYHKGKKSKGDEANGVKEDLKKASIYRNSGIVLLILNLALTSAIAQMIFFDAHFSYVGWTIYAYAAYAFYKITMSVINLVRAHKQADLTVRAVRNINLADAIVSLLALQTALLTAFSDENINVSLMNGITGCAVSLFTLGLGIFMIAYASKQIEILQKEILENGQQ